MLSNYLKTLSPKYKVEFRTDETRGLLIIRVTRGFLFKETMVFLGQASDDAVVIETIRKTVEMIDDAFNDYD